MRQRIHIAATYAAVHISRLVVNPSSERVGGPGTPEITRESVYYFSLPPVSLPSVQTHDATRTTVLILV